MARHVYVHVPFCARRCSYCDFAIAVRKAVPVAEYLDALEREIGIRAGEASHRVDTVYLGGGTPSRLGPDGVARLLDLLRGRFAPVEGAEITIEANPEDIDAGTASGWRRAGITRVSLGVQSFDDGVLRWMHRTHDSARVHQAVAALRDAGFDDWSLDLIFALPPEVPRSWTDDLRRAVDLAPAHISCYGLTVEPHTPLVRWRDRGQVHEADEDRYAEEFLEAHDVLSAGGFDHYEVSNYSRLGRQARHNSAYWRRVAYLGFGPSAHSFDGVTRRWNTREYAAWRDRITRGLDPVEGAETLEPDAVAVEEAYLALRTSRGRPVSTLNAEVIDRWSAQGWVVVSAGIARLTPSGWLRLDALLADLTDLRSR